MPARCASRPFSTAAILPPDDFKHLAVSVFSIVSSPVRARSLQKNRKHGSVLRDIVESVLFLCRFEHSGGHHSFT